MQIYQKPPQNSKLLGKSSHLKVRNFDTGPNQFKKTRATLEQGIQEQVAPGFSLGIFLGKEIEGGLDSSGYWAEAIGLRQNTPHELPLGLETTFDLASVTKVFATASTITAFVERGWLDWNTCVSRLIPEFKHSTVQIRHLLSHTSGLPAWAPFWQEIRKVSHYSHPGFYYRSEDVDSEGKLGGGLALVPIDLRRAVLKKLVCAVELEAKPDERELYSDLSFMLLGWVIEALTQQRLDKAVESTVWKPLHLQGAKFVPVDVGPTVALHNENINFGPVGVAATENCTWRGGVLVGQVHDDNCWAAGGREGHTGAFGTLDDVMAFAKALLVGNFFQSRTRDQIWQKVSATRTLGWDTPSGEAPAAGRHFSKQSVGHVGYTGTSLWIDPVAKVAVSLLSNRVHPSRETEKIKAFRGRIHDAIREDLGF